MKHQDVWQIMLGLVAVTLLLVGCGSQPSPSAPEAAAVTATPIPSTSTPTPKPPTPTPIPPTASPTFTPTPTFTPVPPTSTPTPVPPTVTPTPIPPTPTPLPPTFTPTPPPPTQTPTPVPPTFTPLPPTSTPTSQVALSPELDVVTQLVLQTIQQAGPLGGDKAGVILVNCYDQEFDWYIEQPISEKRLIGKVTGHQDGHCTVSHLEGIFIGLNYDFGFIGGGEKNFGTISVSAPPAQEVGLVKLGPGYSYTKLEGTMRFYIAGLGPQATINKETVQSMLSQMALP